jgi:hypothetical protein
MSATARVISTTDLKIFWFPSPGRVGGPRDWDMGYLAAGPEQQATHHLLVAAGALPDAREGAMR